VARNKLLNKKVHPPAAHSPLSAHPEGLKPGSNRGP